MTSLCSIPHIMTIPHSFPTAAAFDQQQGELNSDQSPESEGYYASATATLSGLFPQQCSQKTEQINKTVTMYTIKQNAGNLFYGCLNFTLNYTSTEHRTETIQNL